MVRYELKYAFAEEGLASVLRAVANHPAHFGEIFHQRQINNIYFDTPDLAAYRANLSGIGSREKYRIRWYGETFGPTVSPRLEIKRKFGLVGDKKSLKLPGFDLAHGFSWYTYAQEIADACAGSDDPESRIFINNLLVQRPTLVNRYQRQYFMTRDGQFRLTVDTGIQYLKITPTYVADDFCAARQVIVEIKFDEKYALDAGALTNAFNWRLTRNSKYVNGVKLLLQGAA